jgi:hypothetical protein
MWEQQKVSSVVALKESRESSETSSTITKQAISLVDAICDGNWIDHHRRSLYTLSFNQTKSYHSVIRIMSDTIVSNALGSAAAGIVGRSLTHPLDTAKARLQAVGEYGYKGPFDVLKRTAQTEGIAGLYRGFGAVIVGGTPGTILYLCSYDIFKTRLSHYENSNSNLNNQNQNDKQPGDESFLVHLASGLLAESIACIVYVPVDVIKERLQVQHSHTTGTGASTNLSHQQYQGGWDALKQISKTEGVRGIYKGYAATLGSFGPFSALYFVFYEKLKKASQERLHTKGELPFLYTVLSSASAGALASWLTSPLDMAKLRLQVQRGNNTADTTAYRGVWDCLVHSYRHQGGVHGLFRGAGARVLHFAPATTVTMTCYETSRSFFQKSMIA